MQQPTARAVVKLGRYRLLVALGQGGMGTIHLAVTAGDGDLDKLLVVKELRRDLTRNQRFVEMFLDEAKLAARLNHPNVVHTIEAGHEAGRYYLSMEFLDGQPFSSILNRPRRSLPPYNTNRTEPPVSLAIRLRILSDALAGLHYAHELRDYDGEKLHIVHRDVSPQNIFVTYDGQVKVVDFGIAKATLNDSISTTPGIFKGKFGYAAPEQVRGEVVDARTDVFAVGVILWEALTMRRFADGPVSRAAVATRLAGEEPRLGQVMPRLDPWLIEICDRALQVDPNARYASAAEFRTAIESYLAACGQRVDGNSIRQVMGAKFAAERRAIHRLIDAHIKNEEPPEMSEVSPIFAAEPGNDNPTAVADLSRYVDSSTDETVVTAIQPPDAEPEPEQEPAPVLSLRVPLPELPHEPVKTRSHARGWIWALAGAAAFGLAFGYAQLTPRSDAVAMQLPPAVPVVATPAPAPEAPVAAPSEVAPEPEPLPVEVEPAPIEELPQVIAEPQPHAAERLHRLSPRARRRARAGQTMAAELARPVAAATPTAAPRPEATNPREAEVAPGAALETRAPAKHARNIDTEF